MKPALLASLVALCLGSLACDGKAAAQKAAPPAAKGLIFKNEAGKEFSFLAKFHRKVAEAGSWHLIVGESGSMASKAFFTTGISPQQFYESLKDLGAKDGNNVSEENMSSEKIATEGDAIELTFDWKGRVGTGVLRLEDLLREVVPDNPASGGPRGLDMRFGGNYTGDDARSPPCHASGCLACLYTCSAGITSNSKANYALLKKEKDVHRYRIRPEFTDLPDEQVVRVTVRKRR